MYAYLSRRIVQTVVTLLCLVTIQFFLFRLVPGDPMAAYIDPSLPIETRDAMRQQFGLDASRLAQYASFVRNFAHGQFGVSFYYREPVAGIIVDRFWNTILLLGPAMIVAFAVGTAAGALLAWIRGRRGEMVGVVLGLLLRSMPEFWVGLIGLMVFSYWLGWAPLGGMRDVGSNVTGLADKFLSVDFLRHLVLPMLCAAAVLLATPLLVMRNSMLEVVRDDFIDMAKAKGLTPAAVIFRHAVRNALLPVVTVLSVMVGVAIGGEVLIETIFRWPGMGRELVLAVQRRDFPMAQAIFFMMGTVVILTNFATDLLYGWLDPRVTYE
jgi:peptide/nickel transport system permease protein